MSKITVVDQMEGDPHLNGAPVGSERRWPVHALVVLAGDGDGPEYELLHPGGCERECGTDFELHEGGFEQPSGYWQIPTEPGVYLVQLTHVVGGWINGEHPVDHDLYFEPVEV
jgi:hypothetical protein